jgi:hypothetical protein
LPTKSVVLSNELVTPVRLESQSAVSLRTVHSAGLPVCTVPCRRAAGSGLRPDSETIHSDHSIRLTSEATHSTLSDPALTDTKPGLKTSVGSPNTTAPARRVICMPNIRSVTPAHRESLLAAPGPGNLQFRTSRSTFPDPDSHAMNFKPSWFERCTKSIATVENEVPVDDKHAYE